MINDVFKKNYKAEACKFWLKQIELLNMEKQQLVGSTLKKEINELNDREINIDLNFEKELKTETENKIESNFEKELKTESQIEIKHEIEIKNESRIENNENFGESNVKNDTIFDIYK